MLELSHNGAKQVAVKIKDGEGEGGGGVEGGDFRFRAADRNVSLKESIFSHEGVLKSDPVFLFTEDIWGAALCQQ